MSAGELARVDVGEQYDPGEHGGTAGDYSLGAEPSNRFVWQVRPGGPFVTVTETYYVTARRDGDAYDMTPEDLADALAEDAARGDDDPDPDPIRYAVDGVTEWILHTSQDDPGGTELAADYDWDYGSALYYSSLAAAEDEARRLARGASAENYSPEQWAPVAGARNASA